MITDEKSFVTIHVRAPKVLKDIVKKCVSADTHTNISEFIRAAIREKIQREAPYLLSHGDELNE